MNAPTLLQSQREMQAYVLHGDRAIFTYVDCGVVAEKMRRLSVYAGAYRSRLVEVLGNDFPVLRACVGASVFDVWAANYLTAHPSRHFSVRYAGSAFAAWLNDQAQSHSHAALTELAVFEWMQGEVFDAQDSHIVVLGDVASIAPEYWPELQLQIQPAARWLTLRSNAPMCVVAYSNNERLPEAIVSESPSQWLLWRRALEVHWRSLPPDEASALAAARAGANFGAICESLRPWHNEEALAPRAASLLKLWICDELITAFKVG